MGNFYKDQDRAKVVIINFCGNKYVDAPTIRREVRSHGLYWGLDKVQDLLDDLVYQQRLTKHKVDDTPFYAGKAFHEASTAAKKAEQSFASELSSLGVAPTKEDVV